MSSFKHVNGLTSCPLCELKLTQAHPRLAEWFRKRVKPNYPEAHVSWSYRGKDDQEQAFLDGKSKLHYPNSKHNTVDETGAPLSEAIDLFELDYHGQASWPWKFFRDIATMADLSADPIVWGGTWADISDGDHFQLNLLHV